MSTHYTQHFFLSSPSYLSHYCFINVTIFDPRVLWQFCVAFLWGHSWYKKSSASFLSSTKAQPWKQEITSANSWQNCRNLNDSNSDTDIIPESSLSESSSEDNGPIWMIRQFMSARNFWKTSSPDISLPQRNLQSWQPRHDTAPRSFYNQQSHEETFHQTNSNTPTN